MKKLLALTLSLLLVFSMAACGEKAAEFEPGKISGTRYESAFAGIVCELGSDWKFMSEEEIRENNKIAADLAGEEYTKAIQQMTNVTDMMANRSNGTDTVLVAFEKVVSTSEQKYAEASKENMQKSLESMGMTNVTVTIGKGTFAGEEHVSIDVSAKYSGFDIYEKCAVVKCGKYMMIVTACTWNTNSCQSVLDKFKKIAE